MPFEDPWLREGKTLSPIDFERRMYDQTKNPLHVWRAFQICSALMRQGAYRSDSLPEWILAYFNTCADVVEEMYGEAVSGSESAPLPTRLAEAFGFKRAAQGVRETAFSKDVQAHRDLMIATTMRSCAWAAMATARCGRCGSMYDARIYIHTLFNGGIGAQHRGHAYSRSR